MLKLEIKLDEGKIREAGRYAPDSLRQTLIQAFVKQQLDSVVESDGTMIFVGRGQAKDYGCFGKMITTLKNQQWFMEYVVRWLWYNSDDGENEEDFAIEDVLKHYTNRISTA